MPQLNPAPWFSMLLFSWLVLLIIVVPKTMAHVSVNNPAAQSVGLHESEPWLWPWI